MPSIDFIKQPGNRLVKIHTTLSTSASSSEIIVVVLQLLVYPCPSLLRLVAGLGLAVHELAVFDVRVGDHLRVADPGALVVLQDRYYLGDEVLGPHLIRGPHFAADAAPHCILGREEPREEVGGTANRCGTVTRACLAVNRQVRRDGEVAGKADLLAAGHSHAVYPADYRLLAHEDGVDHVVEEFHVGAVLFRTHAVIL
jgi:hypothetical protein